MRMIAIVIVLAAVLALAVLDLEGSAKSVAHRGASTVSYQTDINAAKALVDRQTTTP